jgi:pre-rRNA-processing protein IPI1
MFAAQFDREGSSHAGKGKGKARQVGEHGLDEQYEGSLVGCGEWGIEEALSGWELGRLEATSSLSGKEVEIETLTVSYMSHHKHLFLTIQQLYTSLHPLLLSTFLEAAPSAFSPSTSSFSTTDNISLELCTITAALSEILSRSILSHDSEVADIRTVRANASDFLKRMAAWFPFSNPATATSSSTGVSPAFELSLTYSKLAILLAPRPKILVFPKGKKEVGWKLRIRATEESWKTMRSIGKGKGKQADGWALEEVSEWIISVLVSPSIPNHPLVSANNSGPQRRFDTRNDTNSISIHPITLSPSYPLTSNIRYFILNCSSPTIPP